MAAYASQAKVSELIQLASRDAIQRPQANVITSGRVAAREAKPTALGDLGISANQSTRLQALAAMLAKHFESPVASVADRVRSIRIAGNYSD